MTQSWDANSLKVVSNVAVYKADADLTEDDMAVMVTMEGINDGKPFKLPPDDENVAPYKGNWLNGNTLRHYLDAGSTVPKISVEPLNKTARAYINDHMYIGGGTIQIVVENGSRVRDAGTSAAKGGVTYTKYTYTPGKKQIWTIQTGGSTSMVRPNPDVITDIKMTYVEPTGSTASTHVPPAISTIRRLALDESITDRNNGYDAIQSFPSILEIESCMYLPYGMDWNNASRQYGANYRNAANSTIAKENLPYPWREFTVTEDCEIIAIDQQVSYGPGGCWNTADGWENTYIALDDDNIKTRSAGTLQYAHIMLAKAGTTVKHDIGTNGARGCIIVVRPISHKKSN